MDLKKNDAVKGIITDLNDDGQGVLKTASGEVVFVPNTCIGEEVEIVIINTKSKYAIGKLTKILKTADCRVEPKCEYYTKCGGCEIMHLSHDEQMRFKQNKVSRLLKTIAKLDTTVEKCISLNEFYYRNKIALPVQNQEVGLYRKNSHNIVPIENCIITKPWNETIIKLIKQFITTYNISCFNDETKKGLIKHIVAREIDGEILITIVINGTSLPHESDLIKLICKNIKNVNINLNINKLNNNVILGKEWKDLYGKNYLVANEYGINYPVSNASFYQINDQIKKCIYDKCLSLIPPSYTCLDAYSGAGLLSGIISKKAKHCYGVEIIPEATKNADLLKKQNNLTNLTNINGDCSKVIPELVKKLKNEKLIITLDPPRKGCDKNVITAITSVLPEKIIYISCDPATLARDAKLILDSENYTVSLVQPYDMFPQTAHVETLMVFEKLIKQ